MTELQKQARVALETRARRLVKLLDMPDLPSEILCREAVLIFTAAAALNPATTGSTLTQTIARGYAQGQGLCVACFDAPAHGPTGLCPACYRLGAIDGPTEH